MKFSVLIKTNPPEKSSILKGDGFQQNFSLSQFHLQKDGPACQFWRLESAFG